MADPARRRRRAPPSPKPSSSSAPGAAGAPGAGAAGARPRARAAALLHLAMAALFSLFAALQANDPDPAAWVVAYASTAAWSLYACATALSRAPRVPLEGAAAAAVFAFAPPLALLLSRCASPLLLRAWRFLLLAPGGAEGAAPPAPADAAAGEEAREAAGLLVALAWLRLGVVPEAFNGFAGARAAAGARAVPVPPPHAATPAPAPAPTHTPTQAPSPSGFSFLLFGPRAAPAAGAAGGSSGSTITDPGAVSETSGSLSSFAS